MQEILNNAILPALSSILIALLGAAVTYGIQWLKSKGVLAKLEANKDIASIVVSAVEQIFQKTDGTKKLQVAEDYVSKLLSDRGIKITPDEIRLLIENSVKAMNDSAQKELNQPIETKANDIVQSAEIKQYTKPTDTTPTN